MPPQSRATGKAKDAVKVDPPSAGQPRTRPTTPSKKAVAAAIEKSAEHLEQQAQPPTDVHPKPTTPSHDEVEKAVERSAEFVEARSTVADAVATHGRDKTADAAPISAGGSTLGVDSKPVYGGRDKTQDAAPVFSAPTPDKPLD